MLQSDTHDDKEEAVEEAFDVLDEVFDTHYVDTQTTVIDEGREQTSLWFKFETAQYTYHFEVDFWLGNIFLQRRTDEGYETLVKHT